MLTEYICGGYLRKYKKVRSGESQKYGIAPFTYVLQQLRIKFYMHSSHCSYDEDLVQNLIRFDFLNYILQLYGSEKLENTIPYNCRYFKTVLSPCKGVVRVQCVGRFIKNLYEDCGARRYRPEWTVDL